MLMACRLALVFVATLAFNASVAAQQSQQVFPLPEGAYPHDVAPAPDGKVWYSAQRNGALGILDPATGQSREMKLGPKSSPHGVIQGPDGAAWLTDGGQNAIVRVDPKTEEVKVWKLPEDTGYTNLNTAVFDKDGNPLVHGSERVSMAALIRRRVTSRPGKLRAGAGPTGSPRHPRAMSTTRRSQATTSPASTRPPAKPR